MDGGWVSGRSSCEWGVVKGEWEEREEREEKSRRYRNVRTREIKSDFEKKCLTGGALSAGDVGFSVSNTYIAGEIKIDI